MRPCGEGGGRVPRGAAGAVAPGNTLAARMQRLLTKQRSHQEKLLALVAAGTTVGMMVANIPAVLLGEAATRIVPLSTVRIVAAVIFGLIGAWVLAAAFLRPAFGA